MRWNMRRAVVLGTLAGLLLVTSAWAAPGLVGYQGLLTDSAGNPVNGPATMVFALYDNPNAGTLLWSETQAVVPVVQGVYNVQLGTSTPLDAGVFATDDVWLQVVCNGEVLIPRQRLTSVAFSLRAADAETLGGLTPADLDQSAHASITSGNPHGVTAGLIGAATPTDIADHASNAGAHHAKTTSFTELTGQVADTQIPPTIARDSEIAWSNLQGIPTGFADGVDNVGILSEEDPSVGALAAHAVPRWNGGSLVTGTMFDNGNVGIGLSNPATRLHIYGSGSTPQLRLQDTAGYSQIWGGADLHLMTGTTTRLFMQSTGRVGIGTTTPQQRLDVNGNAFVNGTLSFPAKTKYYSIPANSFVSFRTTYSYIISSTGYLWSDMVGNTATFYAPVNLPDGATIRGFTALALDNSILPMTIKLEYLSGTSTTPVEIASVVALPTQGLQTLAYPSAINHQVDNANNIYRVNATWVPYGSAGTNQLLKKTRIEYQITTP